MFLTGLRVLGTGGFRSAMFWWVGAFLLRVIAAQALLKITGMQPQALSSGDLRDRAFGMAERLGVKLQQVYLIPSGKGQIANAFARTNNTISFTDFLLKRMSQREVDYVMAHELTHLKLKHPAKLGYA
jgi:Zn-dependent protease with chaperone function